MAGWREQEHRPEGSALWWADQYLDSLTSAKLSRNTTKAYRTDLHEVIAEVARQLACEPDAVELAGVTLAPLRAAFARFAERRADSSVARAWSSWNGFFGFLLLNGGAEGNPMQAIRKPVLAPRLPKPIIGEDGPERLLTAATQARSFARRQWPERDVAVLALLLCTGVRTAELLGLRVNSISGRPGERRIHVLGKGKRGRTIPIEDSLEALIEVYLASRRVRLPGALPHDAALFVAHDGEPLQRGGLQYLVKSAARAAGVLGDFSPGAAVHALRHTFGTRLAEDGATATEIQRVLGHSSIVTSQTYIDASAREQRHAVRANRTYRTVESLTD